MPPRRPRRKPFPHLWPRPRDTAGIREATEEHLALASKELPLSEKALEMHLQRIVGAYVSSAYGAGQFYTGKVTQARDLTMKVANEDRDEDRDGVSGFESRAERARIFAAEMGLQAHALLAAAEGAVSTYAHLTGSEWKPYEAPSKPERQPRQCNRPDGRLRRITQSGGLGSRLSLLRSYPRPATWHARVSGAGPLACRASGPTACSDRHRSRACRCEAPQAPRKEEIHAEPC